MDFGTGFVFFSSIVSVTIMFVVYFMQMNENIEADKKREHEITMHNLRYPPRDRGTGSSCSSQRVRNLP